MDNITRRDVGFPYKVDEAVQKELLQTRRLVQQFNSIDCCDLSGQQALIQKLLGKCGQDCYIMQPFYCDYGFHISVGDHFFANVNCVILDVGKVTIGDNVFLAPNVAIYTAGHPVHPQTRNSQYEYGIPITIGNNVWIGGNSVILPNVRIGDNTVIGAGSVVTQNVPDNVIAAGNPCKVIRAITEEDKKYYYKQETFDAEAWNELNQ